MSAAVLSTSRDTAPAAFTRDGFAVIRDLFTPAEIEALQRETDRYIRDELPRLPDDAAFYEDKADKGTIFRLEKLSNYNPFFRDLLYSEKTVKLASDLLGEPAAPQHAMMFGKPARVGSATPPHQDSYYWMIEPIDAGVTFWLPLDAVDESNGCVRYLPGSHRKGMRPHGPSKQFGFSLGLLDFGDDDRRDEVPVPVGIGDMIAHSGLTVHRADPNRSDRKRWAIGLVYFAKRAKPDTANRDAYHKKLKEEWEAGNKL